ncbi:substrate-binding periplasmic protein [Thalassotalea sp. PLHSN55]|uniref:substrate-binding periplasmic protein n=1 Tax=Thalassotalea sp. PLHSN55 TaxID=3435888 RepID=UPI003F867576
MKRVNPRQLLLKNLILILGACFSVFAFAQAKIEMTAGLPKPPFITKHNQGMQLDIVRAALALHDIEVKFVHMPFGRNISSYQRFNFGGVLTVKPNSENNGMYTSKPYIRYQNVAVSLTENNFNIYSLSELAGKKVTAFQRAKKYLGAEYNKGIAKASIYREIAEQAQQVSSLFLNRSDVIVLDINIFKYFVNQDQTGRFSKPYTIHYLFDETNYSAGFRDPQIKEKFDQGIATLKASGEYKKILDRYID